MKRREFLKAAAVAAPMIGCFPATLAAITREKPHGLLERRSLGRTGENLSIIGFGGIVVMNATDAEAAQRVRQAIEYGVNYFDVAPRYGDAEIQLGPALEPFRKDVFLACKTRERDRDGGQAELERSLQRLRTDHFDLYQLHAVTSMEDVQTAFAPNGVMETLDRAKQDGKIRFTGFSAHTVETALALMDGYDFDTLLFPINFATWHGGGFGPQVLARAQEKGMGILAIKAMAKGPWPEGATRIPKCWYEPLSDPDEAMMGLRFTLSHPVTSAVPPGNEDLFAMALDLGTRFEPLTADEVVAMKERGLAQNPLFRYTSN
jgi:predicted aldo/keto reductase-like oxidoreductase